MKFSLLVIHAIEEIFDVRYLWFFRSEV